MRISSIREVARPSSSLHAQKSRAPEAAMTIKETGAASATHCVFCASSRQLLLHRLLVSVRGARENTNRDL
jgi:hypothetical protein